MKDRTVNLILFWVSVWMLVIAAICFGTGVIFIEAIYYGVIPAVVSVVCAIAFFVRRRDKCACTCGKCKCCPCFPQFEVKCTTCLERSLCLHVPRNYTEETVTRISALHQQLQMQAIAESSRASTSSSQEPSSTEDQKIRAQLRQLETDINRLYQKHSELENRIAAADEITIPLDRLAYDAHSLQHESKKVKEWIEEHSPKPSPDELEKVNTRLRRIRRHFNVYKLQLSTPEPENRSSSMVEPEHLVRYLGRTHSGTSSLSMMSQDSYSMTSEAMRRFPQHLRLSDYGSPTMSPLTEDLSEQFRDLPPYQEIDPLDIGSLHFPPPGGTSIAGQPGTNQLSRSMCSLAPPPVDFNAPPSYEEATTSQV